MTERDAHAGLVGREADRARLGAFLAELPGAGGALVLLGDPGIGKSALLTALARDAGAAGVRVLHTVGAQYRARTGHGALRQLLASSPEAWSQAAEVPVLGAALAVERPAAPGHDAVADALTTLIAGLSRDRATLLVLDDAHWLDPASGAVLGRVARRLAGTGAGLVAAVRTGEAGSFAYDGLAVHELRPLSEAASEELLRLRFPSLAPRVRRRLMADADGNPLALLELPASLTDSQRADAQALPARIPLTQRLLATFASRVGALPAATRHLLLVAALEGTGDLPAVRRAVAGRCHLKHLAPAERGRLVHVDDATGRLTFRHSLIRSVVVDLSSSDQRRGVHRALADAWAGVPEQRAWHLAQAAEEPDARVADLLEEAADSSVRRGDGPNAVAALLRSAGLSPAAAERARRLAKAAYLGANLTGGLRDVPRLLDDARHAAPGQGSLAAAVAGSAYLLNGSGDIATAHRLLVGALAQRPEPYDPADATLAEAMHTLLLMCFFGGRAELWSAFDAAAARYTALPELVAITRSTFADPARAGREDLARLDAAVAELAHRTDPLHIVRVATAGAYLDRLGDCAEALGRVVDAGRRGENITAALNALFLLGNHAWLTGQWAELRRTAREGLDLCERYHYPLLACPGHFLLACVAAARGDHAAVRDLTGRMQLWAGPRGAEGVRFYVLHAKVLYALGQGDFEDAYRFARSIAPPGELPPHVPHAVWSLLDLAEAAARTGRPGQVRAHVAAARDAGLDTLSPRLRMVLLAAAALGTADDGAAVALFGEALAVENADRWPFEHARILLYRGERLRRGRFPARARAHLRDAAEAFERLGAVPWAERAGHELRACGAPVRAPGGPAAPALTPQQREVARLAATGLTNKQIGEKLFLSPRTVSTHLHQAFPKLGVTSRAALRDALERLPER
ncbi:AAA family ATPase [Streptomyces sp. NPDC093272]|uniref:helix-turn-helix transcriptional regulator n=1 Tax=Streptomyces sp. NPDC093272 TaxID=3154981 RepID=UPI00341C46A7